MTTDAVIILQARMASRRLPGKALAPLGSRTMLAACLSRLQASACAPVLLATTTRPEDDALQQEATRAGVSTFRGPDEDVLLRFVLAARSVGARAVVRATADNPCVDLGSPDRVLRALTSSGADHVIEIGLPYGTAVEAVTTDALERAADRATDPSDREHVTPLIRRDAACFTALRIPAPESVRSPELSLTVDTRDDLERVRRIIVAVSDGGARAGTGLAESEAPLEDIIAAARRVGIGELVP